MYSTKPTRELTTTIKFIFIVFFFRRVITTYIARKTPILLKGLEDVGNGSYSGNTGANNGYDAFVLHLTRIILKCI